MNIALNITKSIQEMLMGMMPEGAANITAMVLVALIYLTIFAVAGLYLVLLERKVAAWFQLRIGPNRVGYWGLLQTMADALKLVSKELTGTVKADKFLYNLAPYFVIVTSLMALAVFPFTQGFQAFDINIGIFFLIAISSIGVIGILLGGWASNNKFALIGAMRSGVQTISYELSIGLSLLTMVLITGSLQLSEIVEVQKSGWLIVQGHIPAIIAFMIYMIAGTAETNRAPFDMVEAESELRCWFSYRIFRNEVRLFLFSRIYKHVHNRGHCNDCLFWWLVVAIRNYRFHSLVGCFLVLMKNVGIGIFNDVVSMDIPKVAGRPITNPRMEVFTTN